MENIGDLNKLKVSELKDLLQQRNLDTKGVKSVLVSRLEEQLKKEEKDDELLNLLEEEEKDENKETDNDDDTVVEKLVKEVEEDELKVEVNTNSNTEKRKENEKDAEEEQHDEEEKRRLRGQRFGIFNEKKDEKEKQRLRALRFGMTNEEKEALNPRIKKRKSPEATEALEANENEKRLARAKKFGLEPSHELKKMDRLKRFGIDLKDLNPRKTKTTPHSLPRKNQKNQNVQQKKPITSKLGGVPSRLDMPLGQLAKGKRKFGRVLGAGQKKFQQNTSHLKKKVKAFRAKVKGGVQKKTFLQKSNISSDPAVLKKRAEKFGIIKP